MECDKLHDNSHLRRFSRWTAGNWPGDCLAKNRAALALGMLPLRAQRSAPAVRREAHCPRAVHQQAGKHVTGRLRGVVHRVWAIWPVDRRRPGLGGLPVLRVCREPRSAGGSGMARRRDEELSHLEFRHRADRPAGGAGMRNLARAAHRPVAGRCVPAAVDSAVRRRASPERRLLRGEVGAAGSKTVASSLVDRQSQRIASRRIDIRVHESGWHAAALAHELTHVVLADRFSVQCCPAGSTRAWPFWPIRPTSNSSTSTS